MYKLLKYKLLKYGVGKINDDGSITTIPNCELNADWIEYQDWLAKGNVPDAMDKEPVIVDVKMLLSDAKTDTEKLNILIEHLGLK